MISHWRRAAQRPSSSFWDALRPRIVGIGAYVNAMTEQEQDRVKAAYGPAKLHLQFHLHHISMARPPRLHLSRVIFDWL